MAIPRVRTINVAILAVAIAAIALVPDAAWAFSAFLKISDCPAGSARGRAFQGQIPLLGLNSSLQIPLSTFTEGTGGGGTVIAGKPKLAPIEVLKVVDNCSPVFFVDAVMGNVSDATISFVRPSPQGIDEVYFTIKLTHVVIVGVEHSTVAKTGQDDLRNIQDPSSTDLNGGAAGLQEIVKLAFRKIELTDVASKQTAVFDLGKLSGAP